MTPDPSALIAAIAALVTAIAGVLAALGVSVHNAGKLSMQGQKIDQVHVLVDGKMSAVQSDLSSALARADQLMQVVTALTHTLPVPGLVAAASPIISAPAPTPQPPQ